MRLLKFYVGLKTKNGYDIQDDNVVFRLAEKALLDAFLGFTKYRVEGAWKGSKGIVYERSVVYEILTDLYGDTKVVKKTIAMRLARLFGQEEVIVIEQEVSSESFGQTEEEPECS